MVVAECAETVWLHVTEEPLRRSTSAAVNGGEATQSGTDLLAF